MHSLQSVCIWPENGVHDQEDKLIPLRRSETEGTAPQRFNLSSALFEKHEELFDDSQSFELYQIVVSRLKRVKGGYRTALGHKQIQKLVPRKQGKLKTQRASLHKLVYQMRALDYNASVKFQLEPYSVKGEQSFAIFVPELEYRRAVQKVMATGGTFELTQAKKHNTKKITFVADKFDTQEIVNRLLAVGMPHDAKLFFKNTMRYHTDRHGTSQNLIQSLSRNGQAIAYRDWINLDAELCHPTLVCKLLSSWIALNGVKCPAPLYQKISRLLAPALRSGSGSTLSSASHLEGGCGFAYVGIREGNSLFLSMTYAAANAVRDFKLKAVEVLGQEAAKDLVSVQINRLIHSPSRSLSKELMLSLPKAVRDELMACLKPLCDIAKAWQLTLCYHKGMRYTNALGVTRACSNIGHRTSSELQALTELMVLDAAAWIRAHGGKVFVHMHDGVVVNLARELLPQLQAHILFKHGINIREKALLFYEPMAEAEEAFERQFTQAENEAFCSAASETLMKSKSFEHWIKLSEGKARC